MPSADAILKLDNVGKIFPGVVALDGIDLQSSCLLVSINRIRAKFS
jgi:ABC-type sugar transport system ATPase subunit